MIAKIGILSLVTSIFVEITWITITTNYAGHEQQLCCKNWHLEFSSFNLCRDHVNYYYEKISLTKIDVLQWLQFLWRSHELVYEKVFLTKIDVLNLTASIFAKITWIAIIRHYADHEWQSCCKNWCSELAMIGVLSSAASIFAGITWITINQAE